MAMIGRGSAIAAMGPHRREVHGPIAFAAWLGVHAAADDRRAHPHRRVHRLGLGQLLDARAARRCSTAPDAAQIDWSEDAHRPSPPPPPRARGNPWT